MKKLTAFIYTSATVALALALQPLAAQSQKSTHTTYALTHASIETVTKGIIQDGTVVISNGKITAVGTSVTVPAGAEVIDCRGRWIYPGLIDANTKLGLSEVAS